jgi:Protein of unknown function (DUF3144)
MPETRHGIPPEFLDAADRFVQLANELNDKYPRDWVAATLLYGAARYAAFVTLTTDEATPPQDEHVTRYFTGQFEKMLRDNLDELTPLYRGAQA